MALKNRLRFLVAVVRALFSLFARVVDGWIEKFADAFHYWLPRSKKFAEEKNETRACAAVSLIVFSVLFDMLLVVVFVCTLVCNVWPGGKKGTICPTKASVYIALYATIGALFCASFCVTCAGDRSYNKANAKRGKRWSKEEA